MLYLRHLTEDGTMMFFPLNPDELYYKCEECGKIIEVEDITGFAFDDKTCLGDYMNVWPKLRKKRNCKQRKNFKIDLKKH